MRLPRTLSAYAMGEVLLYSALGLMALSTLLVGRNLLRHLDELLRAGAPATEIGTVALCLAVSLATYAVPVAFLFGVLLAIGRLAGDAEITAMQSCGIGLRSLMLPVATLGLAFTLLTAFLTFEVEHRAQRLLRLTVQTLAAEGRLIEPGEFRRVGERVLFVKTRDDDDRLHGVLIADKSDPNRPLLIFAERGAIAWDSDLGALHLLLEDGTIHLDPDATSPLDSADIVPVASSHESGHAYRRIAFRSFDYAISADEILGVSLSAHRPREMSNAQLRDVIARAAAGERLTDLRRQDPVYYQLHLQRRMALPVAPLLFAFVGVPLALGPARRGRSLGLIFCALAAFGYYALLTFAHSLARDGAIPAWAAAWLPNAVFAVLAAMLLWRTTRVGGMR
jgi:lipopolysaccharide export system permease protein